MDRMIPKNPTLAKFLEIAKEFCLVRGIPTHAGNDHCLANLLEALYKQGFCDAVDILVKKDK